MVRWWKWWNFQCRTVADFESASVKRNLKERVFHHHFCLCIEAVLHTNSLFESTFPMHQSYDRAHAMNGWVILYTFCWSIFESTRHVLWTNTYTHQIDTIPTLTYSPSLAPSISQFQSHPQFAADPHLFDMSSFPDVQAADSSIFGSVRPMASLAFDPVECSSVYPDTLGLPPDYNPTPAVDMQHLQRLSSSVSSSSSSVSAHSVPSHLSHERHDAMNVEVAPYPLTVWHPTFPLISMFCVLSTFHIDY